MEAEDRKYRTSSARVGGGGGYGAVPPVKMVVGNKCDLGRELRQVSVQEGGKWAKDRRCGFMETSARKMVNVEETFMGMFCLCIVLVTVPSSLSSCH